MSAERAFAYHRSVAPMLWVLVGLAAVELIVAHILVSLFWGAVPALILSLVSALAVGWLIRAILSMRRLPVLLDGERLLMLAGTLRAVNVPTGKISGLRAGWTGADVKQRTVLNLALIAYPNVVVDLIEPLPGRRAINAIAHQLDDPAAFAAAIEALSGGDG